MVKDKLLKNKKEKIFQLKNGILFISKFLNMN